MKTKNIQAVVIIVVFLSVLVSIATAAQDRYTLKALNGVVFSEFRGYEKRQDVAVSETEDGIKAILANPGNDAASDTFKRHYIFTNYPPR
jgi:hypothetical protein